MRNGIVRVSEAEFIAYEDAKLTAFARMIHDSGVSIYEIAQGTGLSWETVKAAANAVSVNHSTLSRIEYYLSKKQQTKEL